MYNQVSFKIAKAMAINRLQKLILILLSVNLRSIDPTKAHRIISALPRKRTGQVRAKIILESNSFEYKK